MMSFVIEYVFPITMLVLLLAACVILGTLPALAVAGGPVSVLLWAVLAAAVMAALIGAVGYMMWKVMWSREAWAGAAIMGVLAAACTLVFPVGMLINGHRDAVRHREMAPKAQTFALERFDEIDADRDGTITDGELEPAAAKLRLNADERECLAYLRAEQADAGHVIDSYTTTTWVWISSGRSGGYMSPIITTHYVYGITRADLDGYPARVVEKYKKW